MANTFPPGFVPDMWQQQNQHQNVMANFSTGLMNFPMASPFPQQMQFGMPPQMFPYIQNSWPNIMFPPGAGQFTSMPPGTSTSSSASTSGANVTATITQSTTDSPVVNTTPKEVEEVAPPKPDLPPLPPTPPPPGTEENEGEDVTEPKVLDDIPLPPPTPKKAGEEVIEEGVPNLEEIPLPPSDQMDDTGQSHTSFYNPRKQSLGVFRNHPVCLSVCPE